jgi:DNA replication protein DnaC
VLFELIVIRDRRRSMLITANQPLGACSRVFPDQSMTPATIDRLVHHATIAIRAGKVHGHQTTMAPTVRRRV